MLAANLTAPTNTTEANLWCLP